jgi:hypothetical protein
MRRLVIVGGIWISLFGATVALKLLFGNHQTTANAVASSDVFDDVLRHLAQTELAARPRKTQRGTAGSAPSSGELRNQQLDSGLRIVIAENQERFRDCATETVAGMKRPNEYFEVSFFLQYDDSVDAFRMHDPVFERTSLAFTAAEERCMLEVFQELRFVAESQPAERMFYSFCFHRPSHLADSG